MRPFPEQVVQAALRYGRPEQLAADDCLLLVKARLKQGQCPPDLLCLSHPIPKQFLQLLVEDIHIQLLQPLTEFADANVREHSVSLLGEADIYDGLAQLDRTNDIVKSHGNNRMDQTHLAH